VPELFVLEFDGFDEADYAKVNEILGIDMNSGDGDWPEGLVTHSAGRTATGWTVVEVWDSREAQENFMNTRLGAALHQAGLDKPPSRAEWTKLHAHHHPKKKA
jgi:hypothetical protein